MKLDHSEVATVKAQASSCKLDDVLGALRKMWGGESLSIKRDQVIERM